MRTYTALPGKKRAGDGAPSASPAGEARLSNSDLLQMYAPGTPAGADRDSQLGEIMRQRMPGGQTRPQAADTSDAVETAMDMSRHLTADAGRAVRLPDALRSRLEEQTGYDMGNVHFRESDQAAQMGAKAFAKGNYIHFAPGEFRPNTPAGAAAISHEVSHVLQQAQGGVRADLPGSQLNVSQALEQQADHQSGFSMGGGGAAVPTMSFAAAPAQGLFGGIKKWFGKAKNEYAFGRATRKRDRIAKRANQMAEEGKTQALSQRPNDASDELREIESIRAVDRVNTQVAEPYQEAVADMMDITGTTPMAEMSNSFWARLGSGNLFKSRRERHKRANDTFNNSLGSAEMGRLDNFDARQARQQGVMESAQQETNTDRARAADSHFHMDLRSIGGGRQVQGLYRQGKENDRYNSDLLEVATSDDGQKNPELTARVISDVYDQIRTFDFDSVNLDDIEEVIQKFPMVNRMFKEYSAASDLMKKHGRKDVLARLHPGEDPDEINAHISAQGAKLGKLYANMRRRLTNKKLTDA